MLCFFLAKLLQYLDVCGLSCHSQHHFNAITLSTFVRKGWLSLLFEGWASGWCAAKRPAWFSHSQDLCAPQWLGGKAEKFMKLFNQLWQFTSFMFVLWLIHVCIWFILKHCFCAEMVGGHLCIKRLGAFKLSYRVERADWSWRERPAARRLQWFPWTCSGLHLGY